MASIVDEYLDTSMDNESEDVFPCKGCGEILEEGKAFELAGNRWHLDCFRCNTCETLLDSDANLLLLGDGSLICNNCTYSCNACGNKIEDLAILTGDQAFCSTCFRCRNCKRKIENLRYARTSQGIFCMGCHETLMARRRKKSKAAAAAKSREKDQPLTQSPMITEKSLPALPPNEIPKNAFSNDRVDPDSDYTPTELSPRARDNHRHDVTLSRSSSKAARSPERQAQPEGLGLSAPSYRNNRRSMIVSGEFINQDDGFFIPVVLDPSPGPPSSSANEKKKDYFNVPKSAFSADSQTSSPHIAFQEKGRQHSYDRDVKPLARAPSTKQDYTSLSSPEEQPQQATRSEGFRLQEAPKSRNVTGTSSSSSSYSALQDAVSGNTSQVPASSESRKNSENTLPPRGWEDVRRQDQDDESLPDVPDKIPAPAEKTNPISRKEVPSAATKNTPAKPGQLGRDSSSDDTPASKPSRPTISTTVADQKKPLGSFTQPRTAPAGSKGDGKTSPKLPRWSNGGDFSMSLDEDMARILGTDEGSSSILRRTSNMVRHGRTTSIEQAQTPSRASHTRSISETTRATASPQWPKTGTAADERNGRTLDVMSPVSPSGDDPVLLKRQLRSSEQRVAELERRFSTKSDLRNLNKKLMEKKKTVSSLDTQTEIMIRQLEVLAKYVEKAKETKTRVDPRELEDSAIKDFVQKLEQVRIQMSGEIEQLHEQRDQLVEEKEQAVADRDRALMEFEQLSSKNAQLADMNNEMAHQLQGRYKNGGLGIYSDKAGTASSINLDAASMSTVPTLVADDDHIVETGPTVVQVRKGQVKKFNWKKGSKGLAQSVAKGVNRAAVAFQQNDRGERIHQQQGLQGDNIGMPYNSMVVPIEQHPPLTPAAQARQAEQHRQGFGFFSKKNAMPKSTSASAVSTPLGPELPSILFGSDLSERAEYERRQIPSVVTRCIEEVELRGMDQEGIYRKTGGNSQVNMIKDGFDRSENFDISEPDLDITAVTSVLKQYFRKLPTPLLTYDVYDRVLESTAIVNETERCDHLRRAFASMPEKHRDCLEFLMFHLGRVAQRQSENLMTPKNLAVVFAPTIMFDHSIEREMTDMHAKNLAVQFVIENSRSIFAES